MAEPAVDALIDQDAEHQRHDDGRRDRGGGEDGDEAQVQPGAGVGALGRDQAEDPADGGDGQGADQDQV